MFALGPLTYHASGQAVSAHASMSVGGPFVRISHKVCSILRRFSAYVLQGRLRHFTPWNLKPCHNQWSPILCAFTGMFSGDPNDRLKSVGAKAGRMGEDFSKKSHIISCSRKSLSSSVSDKGPDVGEWET